MSRVQRALISVHDKTGVVDLGRGLAALGVDILSTGGTAALLHMREDVLDFDRILLSGDSGSHLLDVHFSQGDLIDQAAARGAAWTAAHAPAP